MGVRFSTRRLKTYGLRGILRSNPMLWESGFLREEKMVRPLRAVKCSSNPMLWESGFLRLLHRYSPHVVHIEAVAIPCYGSQVFYILIILLALNGTIITCSNPMLWESGFLLPGEWSPPGRSGAPWVAIPCYGSQVFYSGFRSHLKIGCRIRSNPMLWESGFLRVPGAAPDPHAPSALVAIPCYGSHSRLVGRVSW